jgi:hypothetical protein
VGCTSIGVDVGESDSKPPIRRPSKVLGMRTCVKPTAFGADDWRTGPAHAFTAPRPAHPGLPGLFALVCCSFLPSNACPWISSLPPYAVRPAGPWSFAGTAGARLSFLSFTGAAIMPWSRCKRKAAFLVRQRAYSRSPWPGVKPAGRPFIL